MSNEVFENVKRLPADKQQEVEDFINFLATKYHTESANAKTLADKRRLNFGRLNGKTYISDDFNTTPEDFKDYL